MSTQEEVRALWVSTKERIASFHEEAGYEKIVFTDANHFLTYIQDLSDSWYRFM
ncbi:MAG: hypothetical protein ACI3W5_07260 [Faecousia sp.]